MQYSFSHVYMYVHLLRRRTFSNYPCCSSSGYPRSLPKVNQGLGDFACKAGEVGNKDGEERSPKKRNGCEANGNRSKDSNWNCVDAKMNVVVETHF